MLESTRNEFRWINKRVLENAPCSVGILVDRGLGGNTHVPASNVSSAVTVLFFGGRDDNEALAYGLRMAEHPGISLTVVHFLASLENVGEIVNVDINEDVPSNTKLVAGNNVVSEVKEKIRKNKSIKYEERGVRNSEEIIEGIKEYSRCNLILVGMPLPLGPRDPTHQNQIASAILSYALYYLFAVPHSSLLVLD